MKTLRKLAATLILMLLFNAAALGGIIDTPAPPPAPASTTIPGDIHIPGAPSDSATVAALNLLQNLLSVF